MLEINTLAPDFTLPDKDNVMHSLKDYRDTYVLIYFYPKDDTPGCTKEACAIRDAYEDFGKAGVTVIGISADSPASHKRFVKKYNLPFLLLADTKKEVIADYQARGLNNARRVSYLIDPKSMIIKNYPTVDPTTHGGTILKDVYKLQK